MQSELRFTIRELDLLPDDGNRYEIIDGELYVSKQPDWRHQFTSDGVVGALRSWSIAVGGGIAVSAPGLIFAADEAVAPDVVWISKERIARVIGDDGKLHAAPDLVVEVLSPGSNYEERDRELKRVLYSRRGVGEYWIVDWREPSILVYRRDQAALHLVATLRGDDTLTSPLLPGFAASVRELCAAPA